jgi:membrane-bound serine protease (ClpP class)
MISDASSFDSQTALKDKIINGIVNSQADLFKFVDKKQVTVLGEKYDLKFNPLAEIRTVQMDPGQRILNIFANPMTAYIFFVIGAALLYLEFQAPGGFVAGAIGAVCLVISAIGFQVLPLNYGALGLILLSFILFIIEIYITSYGILTLGGIASLVFGSLFLFRTENAYLDIQLPMVLSVVAAIVVYVLLIGMVIFKTRGQRQSFFNNENMFGHILKFLGKDGDQFIYQVKVNGEIWKASADSEFSDNEKVKIIEQDDEHIQVKISKL